MYTLWFFLEFRQNGSNTEDVPCMLELVRSPITEAEAAEGLFDDLVGL